MAKAIEGLPEEIQPHVAHYDMRFLKPLDRDIMDEVAQRFSHVITVEDGIVSGGLGSAVLEYMSDGGHHCQVHRIGIPDTFVEHGTVAQLREICKMDAASIQRTILEAL